MKSKHLIDLYRPRDWPELIGQNTARNQLAMIARRGLGGQAYWIEGASGVGKTTAALLLATEIAAQYFYQELDASLITPAKLFETERTFQLTAPPPGGRALIINEAHGLTQPCVRQLLTWLERLPEHAALIFTTTVEEYDLFGHASDKQAASALLSRCVCVQLAADDDTAEAFAVRAKEIAQLEGLDGKPHAAYLELVKAHGCNLRRVLQEVEKGIMRG